MLGAFQSAILSSPSGPPTTWDLTIQTTGADQGYSIAIQTGTSPSITVDWGDGSAPDLYSSTGAKSHFYATAGTYTVKISGSFDSGGQFRLGSNSGNRHRLKATKPICLIPGMTSALSIFENCSAITSIPADTFRYNPQITNFEKSFAGCSALTSISTDLFRYNTLASSFSQAFDGCSNLGGVIPSGLFRYNTSVTTFYRTFINCVKLGLSEDVFFVSGEESTRFLNKSVNFQECFFLGAGYQGTQGTAPTLWSCDFGTGTPTKTDCFQGHSETSLSNWADVPEAWR